MMVMTVVYPAMIGPYSQTLIMHPPIQEPY
jgi:hypothetical protein